MFTIFDCDSLHHRRDFMCIGSLALGGLSLSNLFAARASESKELIKDKSVIFLFLHGGPSQIETFDPKMPAPQEIRSATGEVATKLPGITFGGTFPKLAALADKLTVVRSYVPGDANHDIKPIVCRDTFGGNLGSVYSRMAGINHPVTNMPRNAILFPRAVDTSTQQGTMNFGKFDATGPFGTANAPFDPSAGGQLRKNMQLAIPMNQLEDRRKLLAELDKVKWSISEDQLIESLNKTQQQAFNTILSGLSAAFDLSKESEKTIARYDTAPLVRPEAIDKKWKNYNNYVDNGKTLGRLLLLARRLCERGCGFVTVTTNFVWDMHSDVNNAPVGEGMGYMGRPLDYALSALIEDLEARGLSEKILVVACGEMGRTPRINGKGGRDHWGNLGPLLLHGGGLKMGQVIGQSNRTAGDPQTEPVRIQNLIATILHTLFDVGQLRLVPGLPREVQTMTTWDPVAGVVG